MKQLEQIYFTNRNSFRSWLALNFDKSPGIWIIFYKKHVDKECLKYREALEEALCFGWIDSIVKRIDDDQYIQKFTPRKNTSKWSDLNKKIVVELIKNGKMTEEGLQKIDIYLKTGRVDWETNDLKEKKLGISLIECHSQIVVIVWVFTVRSGKSLLTFFDSGRSCRTLLGR